MIDRLLPWLFAALAGPLCVFLALTVPTGQVPDEAAHALRADSLRHFEILGRRVTVSTPDGPPVRRAGVMANLSLLTVAFTFQPIPLAEQKLTRQRREALQKVPWDREDGFAEIPNTAVYMPAFYVPAAIGLAAGRAGGLLPFQSLLLARLLNALVFVSIGCAALAMARAARAAMFATLMLPMTLWLAGSVNEDGLLIAIAVLGAAALTRRGKERDWPDWLAGICIALLAATKPSYLPMSLAMLSGLRWRGLGWVGLRRPAAAAIAVALPGLLWAIVAAVFVAVPFDRPDYLAGPLWPGDPGRVFHATDVGAQMRVLGHAPWLVLTLPWNWLQQFGPSNLLSGIGVLGLLDLSLPRSVYLAWIVALAAALSAASFASGSKPAGVGLLGGGVLGVAVLCSAVAVCLLQYLSWTHVGSRTIEGVQGRYFLPLLPFVGVAISAANLPVRSRLAATLLAAPVLAPVLVSAASVVLVARLVLMTYYLR